MLRRHKMLWFLTNLNSIAHVNFMKNMVIRVFLPLEVYRCIYKVACWPPYYVATPINVRQGAKLTPGRMDG